MPVESVKDNTIKELRAIMVKYNNCDKAALLVM